MGVNDYGDLVGFYPQTGSMCVYVLKDQLELQMQSHLNETGAAYRMLQGPQVS